MVRENSDGTRTPLTMPNHRTIKSSTLRTILTQSGISREEFLKAYNIQLMPPMSGVNGFPKRIDTSFE